MYFFMVWEGRLMSKIKMLSEATLLGSWVTLFSPAPTPALLLSDICVLTTSCYKDTALSGRSPP